jgi:hypothetical protein
LEEDELEGLADEWPIGIPETLRDFWGEGSRRIEFQFSRTPLKSEIEVFRDLPFKNGFSGGIEFYPAKAIFPGNSGIEDWGDKEFLRESMGSRGYELWERTAVISHLGDSDCLALDVHLDYRDPPVIFLSHEGDYHFYLADSFTEFLSRWEKLYYCNLPPSNELCGADEQLAPAVALTDDLGKFLLSKPAIEPANAALAELVEKHIDSAIYPPDLPEKIKLGEISPINWVRINVDKSKLSIKELELLQSFE